MWGVDGSENMNMSMSYHHGAKESPIMIHLKDERLQGEFMAGIMKRRIGILITLALNRKQR